MANIKSTQFNHSIAVQFNKILNNEFIGGSSKNPIRITHVESPDEYSEDSYTPTLLNALEIDWCNASLNLTLFNSVKDKKFNDGEYKIKNTSDLMLLLAKLVKNSEGKRNNPIVSVSQTSTILPIGETTQIKVVSSVPGTFYINTTSGDGWSVTPIDYIKVIAEQEIVYDIKNTLSSAGEKTIPVNAFNLMFIPKDSQKYNAVYPKMPAKEIKITSVKSTNVFYGVTVNPSIIANGLTSSMLTTIFNDKTFASGGTTENVLLNYSFDTPVQNNVDWSTIGIDLSTDEIYYYIIQPTSWPDLNNDKYVYGPLGSLSIDFVKHVTINGIEYSIYKSTYSAGLGASIEVKNIR